jgi:gluconate 2-dehydrogenase gamma chain
MTFISRRDLLRRAAGAAVAVPLGPPVAGASPAKAGHDDSGAAGHDDAQDAARRLQPGAGRDPLENLTATEMDTLEAMVDRLIPSDEHGPGAKEARAARYIDRALGGALAASRPVYAAGLAAIDRYAQSSHGAAFRSLSPSDQDAVLVEVEKGAATGFPNGSTAFFTMVLNHTHQGTFGDPYYGGNANFVGWDLIGYPGVRTMVSASDQKSLEAHTLKPNHRSAYDYDFTKAAGDRHGD